MSEFNGKTVLITGAGRGIGHQIAQDFGVEGANICINYAHSSEDQLTQVVEDTPLKRMTTYEETASFIKLLASESTSFVNGQTIVFDNGLKMR